MCYGRIIFATLDFDRFNLDWNFTLVKPRVC